MGREMLVEEEGPGKCGWAQEKEGRHWETGKAIVMKPNESFKISTENAVLNILGLSCMGGNVDG